MIVSQEHPWNTIEEMSISIQEEEGCNWVEISLYFCNKSYEIPIYEQLQEIVSGIFLKSHHNEEIYVTRLARPALSRRCLPRQCVSHRATRLQHRPNWNDHDR